MTVPIPSDLFFCQISSDKMRTLIEDNFRSQKFQPERSGCDLHQSSGSFELEVIEGFGNKKPEILCVEHTHVGFEKLDQFVKNDYVYDWHDGLNVIYKRI